MKAISDECGTIQSSINKNLDSLEKLLGFKDFLDELEKLTPAHVKAKLEEKRAARNA